METFFFFLLFDSKIEYPKLQKNILYLWLKCFYNSHKRKYIYISNDAINRPIQNYILVNLLYET